MIRILLFLTTMLFATTWEVTGNQAFSSKEILSYVGEQDTFNKLNTTRKLFLLRLARSSIKIAYEKKSFFDADIQSSIKNDSITISIQEGQSYFLKEIKFTQPEWANSTTNHLTLSSKIDAPFDQNKIVDDINTISAAYDTKGYLHHEIKPITQLDLDAKQVYLEFVITPGRQVRQGHFSFITSRGNRKEDSKGVSHQPYLQSLWPYSDGDTVDRAGMNEFRHKILSTGLFSSFTAKDTITDISLGLSHIDIKAVEKAPGSLKPKIFVDPIIGFGISAEASHKNVNGTFHELNSNVLWAQERQKFSIGYAHPLLFGDILKIKDQISILRDKHSLETDSDSTIQRTEIINQGTLYKPFNKHFTLGYLTDLRYIQTDENLVKLKFEPYVQMQFLNRNFNPEKGISSYFAIANSGDLNFNNRYWFYKSYIRLYAPLSSNITWAGSFNHGSFFSKGLYEDARLFFQGGYHSVRGHRLRSLYTCSQIQTDGSCNQTSDAGRTPTYYRTSQEFRLRMPKSWSMQNWQMVSFWDWAMVSDQESNLKNVQGNGIGLGLRYDISFFTFRLDYAFKTDLNNPFQWEPFRQRAIEFDLSQSF